MSKPITTIRLGLNQAAAEFGIDRRTLEKGLADVGATPDAKGKYTIRECHLACFGDIDAQKLRLVKEQADAQAIKNATARRELLPSVDVRAHMEAVLVAIRSGILASGQSKEEKADLINNLKRLGESVSVKSQPEDSEQPLVE